ncbi:hypothetical protein BU15DRAFT_63467 [Melanogaster broomeanus]|nr:hypothetical protein BU15DRAFT_63467 [Melanogaster broomeanus]
MNYHTQNLNAYNHNNPTLNTSQMTHHSQQFRPVQNGNQYMLPHPAGVHEYRYTPVTGNVVPQPQRNRDDLLHSRRDIWEWHHETQPLSGGIPRGPAPGTHLAPPAASYGQVDMVPRPVPATVNQPSPMMAMQGTKRGRKDSIEMDEPSRKTRKENTVPEVTNSTTQPKATKQKSARKLKADGEAALTQYHENWSDSDITLLLETLLGTDTNLFEYLSTNAKYAFTAILVNNGSSRDFAFG